MAFNSVFKGLNRRFGHDIMRQSSRTVQSNTGYLEGNRHRAQSSKSLLFLYCLQRTFTSNSHFTGLWGITRSTDL